ncbi:MAG: META domain-containing protein [Flavobacteriales bacterium]|nr:META domain-containing protein [Flavobacteriales bacterium]
MKKLHIPIAALVLGLMLSSNACSEKTGEAANTRGKWVLEQLGGAAVAMPEGREMPYIEIDSTGQNLTGYAGCNRVFGAMRIWGDSIAFPGLASTRMYCEETQKTEDSFLEALNNARTFAIKGDQLVLSGGKELATFRRGTR